ncbi:unnamed protein product, partial [marine sediment metagenome]
DYIIFIISDSYDWYYDNRGIINIKIDKIE